MRFVFYEYFGAAEKKNQTNKKQAKSSAVFY